jgi:uncharacterized protein (DUF927 family)
MADMTDDFIGEITRGFFSRPDRAALLDPFGWVGRHSPALDVPEDDPAAPLDDDPDDGPAAQEQGEFKLVLHPAEPGQCPGLYRLQRGDSSARWVWFGTPLRVKARTRGEGGQDWGLLVEVTDPDGRRHDYAMPMAALVGTGVEVRAELARLGFAMKAGEAARAWLHDFLATWEPGVRARCVERTGWHGEVFVLPDRAIGPAREPVVQQMPRPPKIAREGTPEDWRREVAALAAGNSRLLFAISLAFAGPLLRLVGEESGGFTEVGKSSSGKSTLLHVAASVAGAEVGTWRATDNALEAVAAGASDLLLALDELGQAPPAVLDAAAYMLGNERGKARATRTGGAREAATWKVALYASGEVGLATKLGEAGKRPKAGQEVRVVDLQADAGAGLGVFEELHGHADGDALSRHLKRASREQRGTALVAFLEALTGDLGKAKATVPGMVRRFVEGACPAGADGQVSRVAGRFGLVAAAGEAATEHGVTGWEPGAAWRAVERRFSEWLEARGGEGAAEEREAVAQVRLFLEQHGASRFADPWTNGPDERVHNRAGFRRQAGEGWTYFVLPEAWKAEVCRGLDPARVADVLHRLGLLERGEGRNWARKERVPSEGQLRLFALKPAIVGGGA